MNHNTPSTATDKAEPAVTSPSRRLLLQGLSLAAPLFSTTLSGCGGASAATVTETPSVTITTEPYDVALVGKAASSTLDVVAGIDRLIALMQEAKTHGARLIACGELWLPGYPVALNFDANWRANNWASYVANSITVGDANWIRITAAARAIGIYLSLGFSEIDANHAYMAQALISDDGTLLYKRRKVRPSGGERAYWSDAPMTDNLSAVTTPLGRITMLECWDHLRPQSTFNVMAQMPNLHICAWPYIPATTATTQWWEREEVAHTAAAYFSQLTGAYTLLTGAGHIGVYRNSEKLSDMGHDDPSALLYQTITPSNWSGATGSSTSEFSYGVLQLLSTNYPGEKVSDAEHGSLNLNPLS